MDYNKEEKSKYIWIVLYKIKQKLLHVANTYDIGSQYYPSDKIDVVLKSKLFPYGIYIYQTVWRSIWKNISVKACI